MCAFRPLVTREPVWSGLGLDGVWPADLPWPVSPSSQPCHVNTGPPHPLAYYLYTESLWVCIMFLRTRGTLSHEPVPHCCPQFYSVQYPTLSACVPVSYAGPGCLPWSGTLPLRSQVSKCFVGASNFREEEDRTQRFMASPCHNLAHRPVPTPWCPGLT